jgi:hypothetical protein
MPDKITELQAKAYRILCQIDQLQLILRQTNQQIAELSKQPVKEDKPEVNDDKDNGK